MSKQKDVDGTDVAVGHWIRNVPYLVYPDSKYRLRMSLEEKWKFCIRVYILPLNYNTNVMLTIQQSTKCPEFVKNYFGWAQYPSHQPLYITLVKVQGDSFVLPKDNARMTIVDLYNYLGLRIDRITFEITSDRKQQWLVSPPRGTPSEFQKDKYDINAVLNRTIHGWVRRNNERVEIIAPGTTSTALDKWYNLSLPVYVTPQQIRAYTITGVDWVIHSNYMVQRSQKRWAAVIITIVGPPSSAASSGSHANLLLIDILRREVYLFDPWGKGQFDNRLLIVNLLEMLGLPIGIYRWRIRETQYWCPNVGPQNLERPLLPEKDLGGYCSLWTFWTLELLIKYPDEELQVILRRAVLEVSKRNKGDMLAFIRGYAERLRKESLLPVAEASNATANTVTQNTGSVAQRRVHTIEPCKSFNVPSAKARWAIIYDIRGVDAETIEELWVNRILCSDKAAYYYRDLDIILQTSNWNVTDDAGLRTILSGRQSLVALTYDRKTHNVTDYKDVEAFNYSHLVIELLPAPLSSLRTSVLPNVKII